MAATTTTVTDGATMPELQEINLIDDAGIAMNNLIGDAGIARINLTVINNSDRNLIGIARAS